MINGPWLKNSVMAKRGLATGEAGQRSQKNIWSHDVSATTRSTAMKFNRRRFLQSTAATAAAGCPGPALLRRTQEGHPFVTDSGHRVLDASLGRIPDPKALARRLADIPGVVEHGLFIGLVAAAIIAGPGGVRIVQANRM